MMFPGEKEDIETVIALGKKWGFGNLIHHLKDAWSLHLQQTSGFSRETADRGAKHICPWCSVDSRTGKVAK